MFFMSKLIYRIIFYIQFFSTHMLKTIFAFLLIQLSFIILAHACETICVSMDFFDCSVCYLSCSDTYNKFDSCQITQCILQDEDGYCLQSQQFPLSESKCISSCCLFDFQLTQFSEESIQQCKQDNSEIVLTVVGVVLGIFACIFLPVLGCFCLSKLICQGSCPCSSSCRQSCCEMFSFVLTCGYCCQCLNSNEIENNNSRMGQSSVQSINTSKKWMQDTLMKQKIEETSLCSICLDMSGQILTECQHVYHVQCIWDWFQKKQSCPNCICIQINPLRYYCQGCFSSNMRIDLRNFTSYQQIQYQLRDRLCPNCKK